MSSLVRKSMQVNGIVTLGFGVLLVVAARPLAAAIAPMNALGRAFTLAQAFLVAVFVATELVGLRPHQRRTT